MINEVSKKFVIIFFFIIQLLILGFGFYILTSTLDIFPWYEPLTLGAFFIQLCLIVVQTIITVIINIMYKNGRLFKDNYRIANLNLGTLIFSIITGVILGNFNDIITILIVITECLMAIFLVRSLIIRNKLYTTEWITTNIDFLK